MMELSSEHGILKVSDEVLTTVASNAVRSCHGVKAIAGRGVTERLSDVLGQDTSASGIILRRTEFGRWSVDIHIVASYGARLGELGRTIAASVASAYQYAINATPERITVHVEAVQE